MITSRYEEQHVVTVEKRISEEDVEKLVEGEDESSGREFTDTMLLSNKESDDRKEHECHKEITEEIVDDEEKKDNDDKIDEKKDDDDHADHLLIRTQKMGSLEIRTKHMQIPIPSHFRSIRTDLSLNKEITKE
nr:hypothetical protein [Tanacetum cinerariifolium]